MWFKKQMNVRPKCKNISSNVEQHKQKIFDKKWVMHHFDHKSWQINWVCKCKSVFWSFLDLNALFTKQSVRSLHYIFLAFNTFSYIEMHRKEKFLAKISHISKTWLNTGMQNKLIIMKLLRWGSMLRSFMCICISIFVFILGKYVCSSFNRVLDMLRWWKPWKFCVGMKCVQIFCRCSRFIHFVLDFPGRNNRQTDEDVASIGNQKRVYACSSRDWRRQDQKHPYHHRSLHHVLHLIVR